MAVMKFTKNMGTKDCIVRGILGGVMLADSILHYRKDNPLRSIESTIGFLFLVYGITGFDPLLKYFGASTIPGTQDYILHQLKQTAPGKGINPMLTQQAVPKTSAHSNNIEIPLANLLIIR